MNSFYSRPVLRCGRSLGLGILLGVLLAGSVAQARLWPWPEDFEEVEGRRLGDRFLTEEEGDSLVKQDLCFDCHDGSVRDDRELWDPGRHGHRPGAEPRSALPAGIPLIEGKLYCGSCHLPHGGLPGSRKEVQKPYLRYENTNDVFCVACHQDRATPGPQESSRNHSFLKKARQDTATADPQAWEKIQGLGGRIGKDGATRCQSCHRPHGAPSRSSLIAEVDRSQMCSICHHDIADSRAGPNHPLHGENAWKVQDRPATVECLTCHRVHQAPIPGVLLAEEGEGLCKRCHEKNQLAEDDLHRGKKLLDSVGQSPVRIASGLCGACHQVHRAKGGFLARAAAELAGSDPDSRFCAGCHVASKTWGEHEIGPHFHFVGAWPSEERSAATRPPEYLPLLLPDGKIPPASQGARGSVLGCRTCHFMHDRPLKPLPQTPARNLRERVSGGKLCLDCHANRTPILGTKHNPLHLEKPEIRERIPVQDENPCSVCHWVHKAQTPRLYPTPLFLTRETDPDSAGCLDCHGPDARKAEAGVGRTFHPLGPPKKEGERLEKELLIPESLPLVPVSPGTAVRAGGQPAGSVSCITCHGLHWASEQEIPPEKSLRPPLSREQACLACHEAERRILAKTKHFIRESKLRGEVERLFGKTAEEHECTPCHRVHQAAGPGLWFVPLPAPRNTFEQDERSRRCLVCHLQDSLTSIREENGHPVGRPMRTEYLPSSEARLKLGRIERDEAGIPDVVVCATCHLNHGVENPDGTFTLFAGGGLPEGDLCLACHEKNRRIVGSPHDFRTRKEGEFRPDDGRSLKFGVCAGCHANHNAALDQGLIVFPVSPPRGQGNPEDMFCLHCHGDPRVLKERPAKFYVHPSGPEVQRRFRETQKEGAAAFPERLGEPGRTTLPGYESLFRIRCRTCHDNHRWTSLATGQSATFTETEMTSFLRGSEVAETLCANCHGEEALYRYRFFHQDRAFRLRIPDE